MIRSRSPKRIVALTARCSSHSSASCSSSCWCSAVSAASCPSESAWSTSARRSESLSMSSLMSSRLLITLSQRRSSASDSRIRLVVTQLLEAALVDAEVVGQLVEDGYPDLLLELGRVGKRLYQGFSVDRDLVR